VGPGSPLSQSTLSLYGTDLGWTFEHDGKLFMLFGDTMPYARYYCDVPRPVNDDTIALLPLSLGDQLPVLDFETVPSSPTDFSPIQVFRDAQSLALGLGQTPLTGFSDGEHAFAAFNRDDYVHCALDLNGVLGCPTGTGFQCSSNVGECQPALDVNPALCDVATQAGCFPGQTCTASVPGYCMDPTSSQYDGTSASEPFAVARNVVFAAQRDDSPGVFDAAFVLATKKFHNVTARTVQHFSGQSQGNDYRAGHGTLLLWGRPGFTGEQGRQAQVYLMTHSLPLAFDVNQQPVDLEPQYFAGVDPGGEPIWSNRQADAKPLAQDGAVDGDPHEDLVMVNQMAISWLPEPIERWVMIYGGDLPDVLLVDPARARTGPSAGAVVVRYAEQPWGPWTRLETLLAPGSPSQVGDPYGPGGFLFHFDCSDEPNAPCARTDPTRPIDALLGGCQAPTTQTDIGRMYGSNIIDAYSKTNGADGLDMFWNISTWNPYGVVLLKTTFQR
jgi:hypothetical protein